MDGYRLDLSSPPDWRPLERLCELCGLQQGLCADEFLYAGRLVGDQLVTVCLYKNSHSRAYLSIDACGHGYRVRIDSDRIVVEIVPLASELVRVHGYRSP